MSLSFLFVDLFVVLVILGSAAYAVWKGFVAETLSIVAWAAAAFASLYLGHWVGRTIAPLIGTPWLSMVIGYAAVFVAAFIPLQFASHRFSEGVKHSPVGPLDRVLGATFGIVRGLAILGVAYLIFTAFVPIRSQPEWLLNARTLPLIQSSSEVILALIPDHGDRPAGSERRTPPPERVEGPRTIEDLLPKPTETRHPPKPAKPEKKPKKGYGAGDRRELDRLIETTGSDGSHTP